MLPRYVASLVVCLGLCAPFVACVGDDPAAPVPGERLGACNPDGTCASGLTCAAQERICVSAGTGTPDAGPVDADRDGAVADSSTEDAAISDAADASELRCGLATDPDVACPDAPCSDPIEKCCIDAITGTHTCARNCGAAAKAFECDARESCGNETHCCAEVTSEVVGAACTSRVELAYAMCLQSCSSQRAACRQDADCPGTGATCVDTEVVLAPGVVRVWGLCSSQ